jgi:hypothetical protein
LGGELIMEAREELLTIAEIAVGLAGFSGVVAAFLQRGGLPPADRLRFVGIFVTAFIAVVLAFVPIALEHGGLRDGSLWRLSSGAMVFCGVVGLASYPASLRRIRAGLELTSWLPPMLLLAPSIANIVLQAANAGAWLWQPNFLPYLIGMLVWLYAAGILFVTTVLYRPRT